MARADWIIDLGSDTRNSGSIRAHPDPSTHPDQPQPRGRWSTGSATNAVVDVCGLRRVDHPNDLQLDARRQDLELPTATTEHHRDLVNYQLVQHAGLERPLRRVRAMDHHVAVP